MDFGILYFQPEEKTSVASNEIPVTHWKPVLNFHVLNEKVDFERQGIPGEIYPFVRYCDGFRN